MSCSSVVRSICSRSNALSVGANALVQSKLLMISNLPACSHLHFVASNPSTAFSLGLCASPPCAKRGR
eukprot:5918409-Pyramimonas_sp.AAC.1